MNTLSAPDVPLFNLYKFRARVDQDIPGYFAVSTAPVNVDDPEEKRAVELVTPEFFEPRVEPQDTIQQIASNLLQNPASEIVVAIHGYSSKFKDAERWYKGIYEYINDDPNIDKAMGPVFIGYRWPSESPAGDGEADTIWTHLRDALKALPTLPSGILAFGVVGILIALFGLIGLAVYSLVFKSFYEPALGLGSVLSLLLLVASVVSFSVILTLILLRVLTYFRDSYRATNFGVPDLVELIRQLDKEVFSQARIPEENWKSDYKGEGRKQRIKLTFIGHSMGCFVVTNAIRILSDVFDPESIGTLNIFDPDKKPSAEVGRVFELGRMVLVAPDIPVETIMPRRANFLRSSLRRFEEAYLFSNEGDLALRLASTTANYFSFPASTRLSGYRLGNLTVKHFKDEKDRSGQPLRYGVVNADLQGGPVGLPYEYLEVRSSNSEHAALAQMRPLPNPNTRPVANLFTYFDCTDYKDHCIPNPPNPRDQEMENPLPPAKPDPAAGIVSYALRRPALQIWDYARLSFAFFILGKDVHGGYFNGEFSRRAIYQLAFIGFKGFLESFETEGHSLNQQLNAFSQICQDKGIQVILAPERYQVEALGQAAVSREGY